MEKWEREKEKEREAEGKDRDEPVARRMAKITFPPHHVPHHFPPHHFPTSPLPHDHTNSHSQSSLPGSRASATRFSTLPSLENTRPPGVAAGTRSRGSGRPFSLRSRP